ncbi:MAG: M64 family metallopeptidase [Myxococcales bacterium]
MTLWHRALACALWLVTEIGCSSEDSVGPATAGSAGVSSSAGTGGVAPNAGATAVGGAAGNSSAAGSLAMGGSAGATPAAGFDAMLTVSALGANQSVGVEWNAVPGATSYKVYFAEGAAATSTSSSVQVTAPHAAFVHRALKNETVYHYAVSAIVGGNESKLSADVSATPTGEWALEELGDGQIEDVATGQPAPRIPLAKRVHLLLFAEGYTVTDLPKFHADDDHAGKRAGDVDAWIDYVFSIAPYKDFREAFAIWYLPRASNTHFDGADTAFMVPVTDAVGTVSATGETATRAWQAIGLHPVPPTDFTSTGFSSTRTHVASFLLFDAARGRAGVSGLTLALRNPAQSAQRIAAAFGIGHAHEFTHAFSSLRDEYIELDNSAPTNPGEMSNVVAANQCSSLPWQHLLSGGAYNANTESLVGAFGTPEQGYHSELVCLLNGTHDNAAHYGGNGLLRDDDRMCNFCREVTAFRIYSRTSILSDDNAGFAIWKASYRAKFFAQFPFQSPAVVPQTNNVQNPAQGMPIYEACSATAQLLRASATPPSFAATNAAAAGNFTRASPARQGCIGEL